jgi:hypothetical protein
MPSPSGLEIEAKRTLKLAFDDFGWTSLVAEAKRERRSLEELLSRAARYLRSELGAGRGALRVPPFARQPQGRGSRIELALTAAVWRDLEAEAARQRVPLERLLEHAALYYLAAVDCGREAAQPSDAEGHRGARPTLNASGRRPSADRPARR